jgi:hypothetical protein
VRRCYEVFCERCGDEVGFKPIDGLCGPCRGRQPEHEVWLEALAAGGRKEIDFTRAPISRYLEVRNYASDELTR